MLSKIFKELRSRPRVFAVVGLILPVSIVLAIYFLMPSNIKGINSLVLGESVDPSLVTSSQAGYQYSAEASNYRASLPLDHSNGVEYGSPNSKQAFKTVPLFTTDAGINDSGRIVYRVSDIEKHIYTFQKNGLKNDIVFDAKPQEDSKTYDYRLETQPGTAARLVEDGSVQILPDPKVGGLVYVMPRPYIVDSNGAKNFKDVNFRLKDNILSLEVRNLLQLQYPLSIDPSTYTVKATGGTITTVNPTSGTADGYVYHTFLASGTFTPTVASLGVEYLVVAGGGGGSGMGGGGAGGLLNTNTTLSQTAYTVTIGAGGASYASGSSSSLGGIVATGGGYAGSPGAAGGSGGGGNTNQSGGTGIAGQGFAGGYGSYYSHDYNDYVGGAGGGGAGSVGSDHGDSGAPGGVGKNVFGSYYAGGGGSEFYIYYTTFWSCPCYGPYFGGSPGGLGGGGAGANGNNPNDGAPNTGGGGGANPYGAAGAGGSGIVVVRYPVDPAIIIKTNTIIKSNTVIKP
jgi:hypothetical protein